MFNPKTVPVEEAIARRLIHEFRGMQRCETLNPRTKATACARGRFQGACEIAALALGAATPFAVHLDVCEAVQGHPALLWGSEQAFPTEVKAAVEAAVAALLAKWGAA